jgi:fibro-slime domain-containing protein
VRSSTSEKEIEMRYSALAWILIGCGSQHAGDQLDAGGDDGPLGGGPDGDASCGQLTAILRDFRADHPDFEHITSTDDRGIVRVDLGGDGKPMYAHAGASPSVAGQASFDQWFRDTAGINLQFEQLLPLTEGPQGTYTFDDQDFFPLDGKGWPNTEIYGHNFLFTTEIHASFTYRGGEQFRFDGDDDVFVFVNHKLALDLGGVHAAESGTIEFDARAAELGLVTGQTYPLEVFHAERHTDQSHFRMVTTIECFIIQ